MDKQKQRVLEPLRLELGNLKSRGSQLKIDLMNLHLLFNETLDSDIILDLFGAPATDHYKRMDVYVSRLRSDKITVLRVGDIDYHWANGSDILLTVDDFVSALYRVGVKLELTDYAIKKYFSGCLVL